VGWNAALALAELHEVHVLTTSEFESNIKEQIASGTLPETLHFHFYEVPFGRWMWRHADGMFKRIIGLGIRIHYKLWQHMVLGTARRLHNEYIFDSAQHITFVRYCDSAFVSRLDIPYIFGPVGGAETTPKSLEGTHSPGGMLVEFFRKAGRWIGEHSRSVKRTMRNASFVLAVTPQTADRCLKIGSSESRTIIYPAIGLPEVECKMLSSISFESETLCFAGFGRMIDWKRFDLALRGFAKANVPDSRFMIIGGGPEENNLRKLAESLEVSDRVLFTGMLPREEALLQIAQMDVLIHSSVHDSGGCVCLEAMSAGRPVICLDWAGPGVLVTDEVGIKVTVGTEDEVIEGIAGAINVLSDEAVRKTKGETAKKLVKSKYHWSSKAAFYSELHFKALSMQREHEVTR